MKTFAAALTIAMMLVAPRAFAQERYVVAGERTRLFGERDALSAAYVAPAVSSSRPQRYVLRVVREHGDWIEVSTLTAVDSANALCGSLGPSYAYPLDVLELRLFVRRDELVPTISRRTEIDLGDGTRAVLLPGVEVGPRDADGRRRITDDVIVALPVPDDAIGTVYARATSGAVAATHTLPFVPSARITIGGRAPELSLPLAISAPVEPLDTTPDADGRVRVRMRARCGEYVLRARATVLSPIDPSASGDRSLGPAIGLLQGDASRYIPAGTRLTLRGGRAIGRARADHTFRAQPEVVGRSSCFRIGETPGLELCVPTASIVTRESMGDLLRGSGGLGL